MMRTIVKNVPELSDNDPQTIEQYAYDNYPGVFSYAYDPLTYDLTVTIAYLIEENRFDLVGINPEIAFNLVKGAYSGSFVQENYPQCYGKAVYPDALGYSARCYDGQLIVWFDPYAL